MRRSYWSKVAVLGGHCPDALIGRLRNVSSHFRLHRQTKEREREREREREGTGDKATSIGGSNKKTKTKEKTTELKDILISRLVLVLLLHLKSDRRDALCSER